MTRVRKQWEGSQEALGLGKRMEQARLMIASMSRPDFCQKHHFAYRTYQRWELGTKVPPIPTLEAFLQALLDEGVVCDLDWLLHGRAPYPYLTHTKEYRTHLAMIPREEILSPTFVIRYGTHYERLCRRVKSLLIKMPEEEVFLCKVRDQALSPWIEKGDFLIAKWQKFQEPEECESYFGVIPIEGDTHIIRQFKKERDCLKLSSNHSQFPEFSISTPQAFGRVLFIIKGTDFT